MTETEQQSSTDFMPKLIVKKIAPKSDVKKKDVEKKPKKTVKKISSQETEKFLSEFYNKRNALIEEIDQFLRKKYIEERDSGTMHPWSELAYHDVKNALFKPKFDI